MIENPMSAEVLRKLSKPHLKLAVGLEELKVKLKSLNPLSESKVF
jgi:hypothetical protein